MEPSDCDEISLYKILYFVRGKDYWWNKVDGGHTTDQKMVKVHGLPGVTTPLTLTLKLPGSSL
jgi:hypothetical protein